jgi:hypothetical protein
MAVEWYLMNNPPNRYSGFENDDFENFAQEGFNELLDSPIAEEIEIFNYDLSVSSIIKAIIHGKEANTDLKSHEREVYVNIGTLKAGMYIKYRNMYWLVTGFVDNDKMCSKALVSLCQYLLKWQNASGTIVERWIHAVSASKYDVGEDGNKTIVVSSNTFAIMIPNDDESMNLEEKRVFIDKRKINPTKIFKITRNDDILSDYEHGDGGGILNLIADKNSFNKDTDNQELRLCDYISPTTPPDPGEPSQSGILCTITYKGDASIIVGGNAKTFTATYKDANGNDVSSNYSTIWSIVGSPINELLLTPTVNSVKIKCAENDKLINTTFTLKATGTHDSETIETTLSVSLKSIY